MIQREIRCHACTATTVISWKNTDDLVDQLHKRGWDNTRGVIACKAHRHVSAMPRPLKR